MAANRLQKPLEILLRDRIILNIIDYPAKKGRINLHWAPLCTQKPGGIVRRRKNSPVQNFGDILSPAIYTHMLGLRGLDPHRPVKQTKHLYALGSILLLGHQNATVWGSGILMQDEPPNLKWRRSRYRSLDIRCVRGPLTAARLAQNGYDLSRCVYGDPGVLMPLIYTPRETEKRDYSVIVHMSQASQGIPAGNRIEALTASWQKTIDLIYNSRLVISSSLHGIIVAEAYGVPAILLDMLEFDDMFKYDDYYQSTGRKTYAVCRSVKEALCMPAPPLPNLRTLQNNLLGSFPADLWET